jgi:ribulose-5-phosphate 4-epimerase/fuculose-1-phosphate aldolase
MLAVRMPRLLRRNSRPYSDREQGARVAKALGDRKAVLMRSHGVAIVGSSIEQTVILAVTLEKACLMQLLTLAAGVEAQEFDHADVRKFQSRLGSFAQYSINYEVGRFPNYLPSRVSKP